MEVNQETIQHLAQLSNFALTDKESEHLMSDIEEIIKYVSQLDELDVENTEATYQVTDLENIWRLDEIMPQDADREQLLDLTKTTQDYQIKVPKVL